MYILKFHFSNELDELRISEDIDGLKKYAEEKFEGTGLYEDIYYKEIGEFTFIYGDGEEIGVIGEVEKR